MARNQRKGAQALRWQTLGFVLFAVASLTAMTLGYVLQRRAHHQLGAQLGQLERQAQALNAVLDQRRIVHTRLSSAPELRQRIHELHLDLTNIVASQRLFVQMPQARSLAATAPAAPVPPPALAEGSAFRPPLAAAGR